jgi:hypothetical protein
MVQGCYSSESTRDRSRGGRLTVVCPIRDKGDGKTEQGANEDVLPVIWIVS